jgi:chemotaxis family two-component system sensor histidine kinase/response regulator PixL
MTIDSDIRDQAYQFFIEEAPELLQEMEAGILALRQGRDTATVHSIMRAAHSLKGSSASVGLEAIKTLSHRLETIFKALYSDTVDLDNELETQLLQAYDCLRLPLLEQLQYGQFDPQQALATADPILSQLETQLSESIAATANFIPSSEDLGMDMAKSIFEIDVGEGLERLAAVVANPSGQEVTGELRAQADLFSGFAELLGLKGFEDIATAVMQALDRHPDQAITIAQLALEDFRAGRAEVLSQANSQGGAPSSALLALAAGEGSEIAAPGIDESLDQAAVGLGQFGEDFGGDGAQRQGLTELELFELFEHEVTSSPLAAVSHNQTDSPPDLEDNLFGQALDQLVAIADLNLALDDATTITPAETNIGVPDPATPDPATAEASPFSQSVSPAIPGPQPPVTREPVAAGLTVRVEADRLNRMNNLLGELTINRNGVGLQNSQLRSSVKDLLSRFSQFRKIVENLRLLADHMLIAPERQPRSALAMSGVTAPPASLKGEFDSLEMDSYTQLYSQTQTLLEEMLQLEETVEDVALFSYQSEQLLGRHRKMLSTMQDELMWARMIPLEQVLNRFPRILRDLSNTYGKVVNLQLSGTDILVDKAVLSKLYDPLVQLLRNSFDHGIEPPELRQRRGKPEAGQIAIQARYQGRQVVIEVWDDGQGLNFGQIRDRALELGWLSPEAAPTYSEEHLSQFIFKPGFSTAQQVSELSGRGVGLDIVQDQIQSLKGSILVTSSPGEGTVFTLTLPLTLTMINLLICFVGPTPLAIRSDSIQEILVPAPEQLRNVGAQRFLSWQGDDIPTFSLAALLRYNCLVPEMPPSRVLATVPAPTNWAAPMLVLRRGEQAFALQVDRLVTEQEMVVKPFGTAIQSPIFAYGCTVLGDGNLVPVIDGPVFLDNMIGLGLATLPEASEKDILTSLAEQNAVDGSNIDVQRLQATTVLVVDDAVTLRRTLALSLERAGYRVLQARDGQEALEQLEQSQSIQLIICDVEMPNMNGFEFLTKRRETPQFAQIPTLMLTSRGNDKHRRLAMRLGAIDYFTKPYLEQELLEAVAIYIGEKANNPRLSNRWANR